MLQCDCLRGLLSCAAAVVLIVGSDAAGAVIHVDASAPDGGDGTEWDKALNDLHDGLGVAQNGDEIWVAAGTYTPAPPNGDRYVSFELVGGVAMYGGFAGWETDLDQRDWVANETILGGDLNGDDEPGFVNVNENSLHVLQASGQYPGVVLDGFTITGGNAGGEEWEDRYGGGLYASNTDVELVNCNFIMNRAYWAQGSGDGIGGGAYIVNGNLRLTDCLFSSNYARTCGALRAFSENDKDVTVSGCDFRKNEAEAVAGVSIGDVLSANITDCRFVSNNASIASGGALFGHVGTLSISGCEFLANTASLVEGGCTIFGGEAVISDCLFAENTAGLFTGGLGLGDGPKTVVNCAFSNNAAGLGGGMYCGCELQMANCSFSRNEGHGLVVNRPDEVQLHYIANCVFWDNVPEQVVYDPDLPGSHTLPTICYSDIQGGWDGPGWNNIDADPLFVQPGADNLRLSIGSPCLDMGSNDEIPDWVQYDLDGNPRIINGIVDMGAYEGAGQALPPADIDYDIDRGDVSMLVPDAEEFDPEKASVVLLVNTTGPDGATAMVAEHDDNPHPDAHGFSEVSSVLAEETSLAPGQFKASMYVSFDGSDLNGIDPLTLDMTCFDEATGNWTLAVTANTQNSPGYELTIGDRHVAVAPNGWGTNGELGDYGVFWNPGEQTGFVWANVDHAGDFAVGTALCRPDCLQPPDSLVALEDILFALDGWDRTDGPFDVNLDGTTDIDDVFAILAAWGACP